MNTEPAFSPPRRFGPDYAERATVGGLELAFRNIRPTDKPHLVAAFERMSPQSRWQRFLGARSALSDKELVYLSEVDGEDHVAIAAFDGDSLVGVARFVRFRPGARVAELAIAVIDDYHRRGIGKALIGRLIEAALEREITSLRVITSFDNGGMKRLVRGMRGTSKTLSSDSGIVTYAVELHPAPTLVAG